jgi:hypothetical protein
MESKEGAWKFDIIFNIFDIFDTGSYQECFFLTLAHFIYYYFFF